MIIKKIDIKDKIVVIHLDKGQFQVSIETYLENHLLIGEEITDKEIKKLGLKIAFGGILTFKNSVTAPKVCEIADLEDILIETDCPYLTPHPYRGLVNEPKYTSLVAQKIAEIKGICYDTVIDITS